MSKVEVISYLKTVSTILTSFIFLLFPLFLMVNTTDFFIFPKQMLIVYGTIILMFLWGLRMYFERRLVVRANPFTLAVVIFGIVILLSSLFSQHLFDSLLQSIPFLFIIFFFFTVVNTVEDKNSFNITLSSLVLGAVISSIISILYYFKIYFLPFPAIQTEFFNTFGSAIQYLAYVIPVLIVASFHLVKKSHLAQIKSNYNVVFQIVSSVLILAGIVIVILQIVNAPQKPVLLPYQDGFQIALYSISQDVGRMLQAFLLGSGYGTFVIDFNRFHLPTLNANQTLWNTSFASSSSFLLELLSTAGVLGAVAFFFLLVKVVRTRTKVLNPLYTGLLVIFGLSFFIPFSFTLVFLLFALLALYTSFLYIDRDKRVYNMTISLVALQEGLFSFEEAGVTPSRKEGRNLAVLPIGYLVVVLLVAGFVGYFSTRLIISDMKFAQSLAPSTLSNGQRVYNLQQEAISNFPYRSDYYRVFSQVNLSLANNVIAQTPQGATPSAEVQQGVLNLLQQSINSGRLAVSYAPLSSTNWESLGQVYRALINVGENAEEFSVGSFQQAIRLNPSNPNLYIQLGGVYYSLNAPDLAANQFALATQLKPDLANGWYNYGKALEQKNDLQNALAAYQRVRELVQDNKDNLKQINTEIAALEKKIGDTAQNTGQQEQVAGAATDATGQPLEVNQPESVLPPQENPVKLPAPPITPEPTEKAGPNSPTPTGATPTSNP